MPTKTVFTLVAAISIVVAGCSSDDGAATTTGLSAPTTVAQSTAPTTVAQTTAPTTVAQPTGLPPTSYREFRQQAATCGADTPAEIAVSVVAELVKVRRLVGAG